MDAKNPNFIMWFPLLPLDCRDAQISYHCHHLQEPICLSIMLVYRHMDYLLSMLPNQVNPRNLGTMWVD